MFDNYLVPLYQGTTGGITKKKLAEIENSTTFAWVFQHLVEMALDYRYSFKGLPKTIDERVFKQSLLFYGSACLFTIDGNPIALPCVGDGTGIDIYGNPRKAFIFSRNGKINENIKLNYKYDVSEIDKLVLGIDSAGSDKYENGVCVWENKNRTPFIWVTIYFATKIADTYRTLDSCKRWLKMPFIARVAESEAKSFDESLKKLLNNEDFNVSLKAHNIADSDIFKVDMPPAQVTSVTQLIEWYLNQYRILCGINSNEQIDKKGENLVKAEVEVNNEYTDLNTNSTIEELNYHIDTFNSLVGTSIKAVKTETQREITKFLNESNESNSVDNNGGNFNE